MTRTQDDSIRPDQFQADPSQAPQTSPALAVDWVGRRCVACEGGIPVIDTESAVRFTAALDGWHLDESGTFIERKFNCGNFDKAVRRIGRIAELAEAEQHHPDLHLTGYRHLRVVLTTHAIGGLSENDFIVAAKINQMEAPR